MEPIRILIVDDNPEDVELARVAFEEFELPHRLAVCDDGEAALAYLERSSAEPQGLPDVVLLDLHLPKRSGREILDAIKKAPGLRKIPVLVLTTVASSRDMDILSTYPQTRITTKPFEFSGYRAIVDTIRGWAAHPDEVSVP